MSTPFFRWGEFAHNPALEIFNPYVALQDWTGSPLPVLSGVPESDRAQAGYVPSLNAPFRQSTLLGWRALARLNLSTLLWQNSRSRDTTYG